MNPLLLSQQVTKMLWNPFNGRACFSLCMIPNLFLTAKLLNWLKIKTNLRAVAAGTRLKTAEASSSTCTTLIAVFSFSGLNFCFKVALVAQTPYTLVSPRMFWRFSNVVVLSILTSSTVCDTPNFVLDIA
jgi:hypothetical protein